MREQRHVIKRQIFNLEVDQPDEAQWLHDRMGHIYRSRIVPLIDRLCTELSDPDSIHRIASLEVDVGYVDPDHFEEQFVSQLSRQLETRLAELIDAQLRTTGGGGSQLKTDSQLELIEIFARTGSLPWWADTSPPQLLESALAHLLQHAATPLRQLMHELARQQQPLRRLVHHYNDAMLADLFGVLAGSSESALLDLLQELRKALAASNLDSGIQRRELRHVFWHAVLLTAAQEPAKCRAPLTLCRRVLLQLAAQWRIDYAALVSEVRKAVRRTEASMARPLESVLDTLCMQVDHDEPATPRNQESLSETIDRLRQALSRGPLPPATIRRWLAELQQLRAAQLPSDVLSDLTARLQAAAQAETDRGEPVAPRDRESLQETIQRLRNALAQRLLPPKTIRQWIEDLRRQEAIGLPLSARSDMIQMLEQAARAEAFGIEPVAPLDGETLEATIQLLRHAAAQGLLPPTTIRTWLADLQQRDAAQLPPDVSFELAAKLTEAAQAETARGESVAPRDRESLQETIQRLRNALAQRLLPPTTIRQWLENLQQHEAIGLPADVASELTSLLQEAAQAEAVRGQRVSPPDREVLEETIQLFRRALAHGLLRPATIHQWLADLQQDGAAQPPPDVVAAITEMLQQAAQAEVVRGQTVSPRDGEVLEETIQLFRRATAQGLLPPATIRKWLADLQQRDASQLPTEVLSELTAMHEAAASEDTIPSLEETETADDLRFSTDRRFSTGDESYVNNAGLVLLSPFLGHFFGNLELLEGHRFKDPASLHRAVGLLQYLATEDPVPVEYALPLCKVLCGMELAEVFDFGPPVTEAEAAECTNLLTAVIEHASILKDMSTAGFRGSFLIREGVLDTRDAAWLLRVERETYDVVLDRFPWTVDWVKLPWMAAALRVEW